MNNQKEPVFRHEYKYLISTAQMMILKNRIKFLLKPDPHSGNNGMYNIRSLYFDDYYNRCYYDKENGSDIRDKYRIRIYNSSDERIRLEQKIQIRGKIHKKSCPLTKTQATMLMQGKTPENAEAPLLQQLINEFNCSRMRPVIIVDYNRFPFVCKQGNVRITFDTNISSSTAISSFFNKNIPKRPVLETGMHLLEVKFDEYLPDTIFNALQLDNLQHTSFSKYCICRKFNNIGEYLCL